MQPSGKGLLRVPSKKHPVAQGDDFTKDDDLPIRDMSEEETVAAIKKLMRRRNN